MKSKQPHLYVTSLAVSFVICLVGMLVAAVGAIGNWHQVMTVGAILTLPLTVLLIVPSLALIGLGPVFMILAVGASSASSFLAKAVTAVLALAAAGWAIFFGSAIYGWTVGRWVSIGW